MSTEKKERNADLVRKREQGWTFRKLGVWFGIRRQVAWEIYHRVKARGE